MRPGARSAASLEEVRGNLLTSDRVLRPPFGRPQPAVSRGGNDRIVQQPFLGISATGKHRCLRTASVPAADALEERGHAERRLVENDEVNVADVDADLESRGGEQNDRTVTPR